MNICLYGASSPALDCVYFDAAEEFGRLLAQHGHTLVYGGGAQGVMGAAARAAYGILAGHLGNTMSVAGGIVVGAIVYAILVLVLRIVSKDDLSLMPKGDKIAKLLHIK